MDPNVYPITVPVIVVVLATIGWLAVQRQVSQNDEVKREEKRKLEADLTAIRTEQQRLGIELEKRITREDLDKVYDAVEKVRTDNMAGTLKIIELLTVQAGRHQGEGHG